MFRNLFGEDPVRSAAEIESSHATDAQRRERLLIAVGLATQTVPVAADRIRLEDLASGAGVSAAKLRRGGVDATLIKNAGVSFGALVEMVYGARAGAAMCRSAPEVVGADLRDLGITASDLDDASMHEFFMAAIENLGAVGLGKSLMQSPKDAVAIARHPELGLTLPETIAGCEQDGEAVCEVLLETRRLRVKANALLPPTMIQYETNIFHGLDLNLLLKHGVTRKLLEKAGFIYSDLVEMNGVNSETMGELGYAF